MNVAQVTAEILKREGVDVLFTYPLNPLTESAAAVNIRPIVVRQERVGVHMADAMSRMTSGDNVGGHPGRVSAQHRLLEAELQCRAEFPAHHQACRDGEHARAAGAGAAPCVQ